jgi:hypothetical protein
MVMQFKSFGFAANQKVLISGLQQRDAMVASSAFLTLGLGGITYALKMATAGRDISDKPEVWVAEAIDRSGMLGFVGEVNGISEKVTGGRVGISALVGKEPLSRFTSRNAIGALLGPTFGTAEDMRQVLFDVTNGEADEKTVHALRKMAPYQNLFYLRWLFDQIEGRERK